MINNAKVLKTDIACTNGVIQVIDTVIPPPPGEFGSTEVGQVTGFSTNLLKTPDRSRIGR